MNTTSCVVVVGYNGNRVHDIQKLRELCKTLYNARLILLVVIGLNLLDQQNQPCVIALSAKVAQLLDIVNPIAVVPDHHYA